jgi:hypothetical protein
MWYWAANVGTIPIGAELARVALKTKAEERMVMYHLFSRDQFCITRVSFPVKGRANRGTHHRVLSLSLLPLHNNPLLVNARYPL